MAERSRKLKKKAFIAKIVMAIGCGIVGGIITVIHPFKPYQIFEYWAIYTVLFLICIKLFGKNIRSLDND